MPLKVFGSSNDGNKGSSFLFGNLAASASAAPAMVSRLGLPAGDLALRMGSSKIVRSAVDR